MPSRSRLLFHLTLVLVLSIVSPLVLADGDAPREAKPQADRVYVTNGATISWDLNGQRMRPPTARQAEQLAEQFRAWMEAKLAGDETALPATGKIEVETLPNGVTKARLPAYLMNAAMVRVDAEGQLVGACSEASSVVARSVVAQSEPAASSEGSPSTEEK